MKKNLILCLGIVFIAASVSFADNSKTENKLDFWEKLRNKIETLMPKKELPVTTAVGGVRGIKNETAGNLYWKDPEAKVNVPEEELEIFKTALQLVDEGKAQEAGVLFEKFISEFPESHLTADARQAVAVIQAAAGEPDGE